MGHVFWIATSPGTAALAFLVQIRLTPKLFHYVRSFPFPVAFVFVRHRAAIAGHFLSVQGNILGSQEHL